MRTMFHNFFAAIATLFSAVERGANALDSNAKWAEAETRDFEETAALEREHQLAELKTQLKSVVLPTRHPPGRSPFLTMHIPYTGDRSSLDRWRLCLPQSHRQKGSGAQCGCSDLYPQPH